MTAHGFGDPTRIHLCRHGEVDPAWHGRIYGGLDVDLDAAGLRRFDALAEELAGQDFDHVYSSGLTRATLGAERIAARHDLGVEIEERFVEVDRGDWAGKALDTLEEEQPGAFEAYYDDPYGYEAHGGESFLDLEARVRAALEDLADAHPHETTLVVCHGQVIRVAIGSVLGLRDKRIFQISTSYGGLTTLDRYDDGHWVLQAINAPTLRTEAWGGRTYKP